MFKQQKAKTYGKDKIKDLSGTWRLSKKYDGHQVFIEKIGTEVKFFTSQGKQFNIEVIREPLSTLEEDFVLIGEYLYNCDGKLGSRAKSAKLTTFRTNYSKGKLNNTIDEELSKVMIFDCIQLCANTSLYNMPFTERINFLMQLELPKQLQVVHTTTLCTFETAKDLVETWVLNGWEGGMLMRPDAPYDYGKRVHHAVKLKGRPTADLLCIQIAPGTGKYEGLIGSLALRDSEGRIVYVGSGLSDEQRNKTKDYFIGKIIEISYEQVNDTTYIQPVFVGVRLDKDKED